MAELRVAIIGCGRKDKGKTGCAIGHDHDVVHRKLLRRARHPQAPLEAHKLHAQPVLR